MPLTEISAHLGVGVEVVEPKAIELCGMGHGKIVNGSLITPIFLDQFLEELSEQIVDLGRISLSDLTNKYMLPIDYIKEVIKNAKPSQLPRGTSL